MAAVGLPQHLVLLDGVVRTLIEAIGSDPHVVVLLSTVCRGDHVQDCIVASVTYLRDVQAEVVHGCSPSARRHIGREVQQATVDQHNYLRSRVSQLSDLIEAVFQ